MKEQNKQMKKVCGFHVNDWHLTTMILPYIHKEIEKEKLVSFATNLVDIAHEGLVARGKNEDSILLPLFERAKNLRCPAQYVLDNKGKLDEIIKEYATIKKA